MGAPSKGGNSRSKGGSKGGFRPEGKGATSGYSEESKKAPVLSKRRTLELITSLAEDDDEREAISKKVSWILRHGAQRVGIHKNDEGFVKLNDLLKVEIMEEITFAKLMSVIAESNSQKPRYELKDSPEGKIMRAIKKEERRAIQAESKLGSGFVKQISISAATTLRSEAPAFVPSVAKTAAVATPSYLMAGGYSPMATSPMANPWAAAGFYPGFFPPQMAQVAAAATAAQASAAAVAAAPSAGAGRFNGKIKSFNDEKGFGFIESPQAQAQFGRDVFLHKACIGDLKVGMDVNFTLETNKQGMPQARDVKAGGGSSGGKGSPSGKGADSKGKGRGKGKDGKDGGKGRGRGKGKDKKGEEGGEKKEPVKPGEVPASSAAEPAPPPPAPAPPPPVPSA